MQQNQKFLEKHRDLDHIDLDHQQELIQKPKRIREPRDAITLFKRDFQKEKMSLIKRENRYITNGEAIKIYHEHYSWLDTWKSLPSHLKKIYLDKAKKEQDHYKVCLAELESYYRRSAEKKIRDSMVLETKERKSKDHTHNDAIHNLLESDNSQLMDMDLKLVDVFYSGFDVDVTVHNSNVDSHFNVDYHSNVDHHSNIDLVQDSNQSGANDKCEKNGLECVICFDVQRNTLLRPCKHVALCDGCSKTVKVCPICKAQINEIEIIYIV